MKIIVIASLAESLINFRGVLLKSFVEAGHEVIGCAPGLSPKVVAELQEMGVKYNSIPLSRTGMNPFSDIKLFFNLVCLFKELKPDIVLGYTIKPVIYGSLAAHFAKVPSYFSMITGLGYVFLGKTPRQSLTQSLARFLYRHALAGNERVFFQNPDDSKLFYKLKLLRSKEQAVLINGSGVDLDHYNLCNLLRKPNFLLIARLLNDKGIREYVAAAELLKQKYPHATFRLLGPLDSNPSAISKVQIDKWQSDGSIEYCGKATDVRPYIKACSIYVLPSYREGTPRTVLEAMSMGRPIVTTDAPGCRQTVVDKKNGFLVPIKNINALADAMERFILNPTLISTMGNASRKIAEDLFNVHDINRIIMNTMKVNI